MNDSKPPLDILILAAGQGTRMRSARPKVLHDIAGKAMLQHVIDRARTLGTANLKVIIGHGAEQVQAVISGPDIEWVAQHEQLGTGHAVQQALPVLDSKAVCLILYGDVPLTDPATMARLIELVDQDAMALLTVQLADPSGYGRILRDQSGAVQAIVEHKDASDAQRQISEVNTGIMAVRSEDLLRWLPALSNDNAQGEYYLTDIIAMAVADGRTVRTAEPDNEQEVQGVNDKRQLAMLERWYQQQQALQLMTQGATLRDPERIDIRGELRIGQDVMIDVNTVFEGQVNLGDAVSIGPNCLIINSRIEAGVEIKANSVIEDSVVERDCVVGPFARLRPGTRLEAGARIGNFVEVKKSHIGKGSKVNHLSYIGDADIGVNANIGAGTITCNYDGVNKSKTRIGDGAFIGSNTALVAPVEVGNNATVGAGSVINKNVDDGVLAVARGSQKTIRSWKRPTKREE